MNYIGPGKYHNIEKSILKNINLEIEKCSNIEKYSNIEKNKNLYAWAISTKNRWKFYNPSDGEFIGIYVSGQENTILYIGKILFSTNSLELSKKIWGNSNKEKVIIFEKKNEIKITRSNIWKIFNNDKKLQSLKSTNIDLNDLKIYNLEYSYSNTNNLKYKNLIDNLLMKIDRTKSDNELKIQEKNKNKQDKKNNSNFKKFKLTKKEDPNYPKNLIGLCGENICYKYLCNIKDKKIDDTFFFKALNFEQNEFIKEIIFYNNDVEILLNEFQDKSIGMGHDIKIITTNKREIELEVKSSNYIVNIIHMSHNELLEMKKHETNLLLVNEVLSTSPKINIVRNFSELYTEEFIKMTLKISINISELSSKYWV